MCIIRLFAIFHYNNNNMYKILLTFVTTNVMMHTMQYRHHRYRMVVVVVVVVDAQRTDNGRDTCVRENCISYYSRNTRRISRRLGLRRCPVRVYVERNASQRTHFREIQWRRAHDRLLLWLINDSNNNNNNNDDNNNMQTRTTNTRGRR